MKHANSPLDLPTAHLTRAADMAHKCTRLAMSARGHEAIAEAVNLNRAAADRVSTLQSTWADQWKAWYDYASALPDVNTLPKYLDRTGNIALQAQAQMVSQMSDISELYENMTVSYSYWLSKQLEK